ncbi:Rha family transcriptional regulator [Limosilactobacillus reuteri]|uniref:Rha family transcriptional regulator n=1 Tax=Limosilactobacillus reuteri TaxID=1598 RepID=UPI001E37C116|nr:Rha family transcriptional regulator [Limosilactobacillus reuteri]MCC4344757.1 Rha family transcriptional regulator [Limosilactobacillus reuteri]WJK31541.1 Rha family transcriptional regulator [Limosilactobacillus reuteri]
MNELVIMKNRQAVTTSLQVSVNFKKRHDHILRDVDAMKKDVPNFGEMFSQATTTDSYGRERRIYYMNRDGFSLLAMGFTGKKALQFKLKYIKAFNEMEKKQLKQLNQALSIEELNLRNRELNFKERWLGEMEAQNANKRAELLIKLANHSTKAPLRNDLLNEAMNQLMLPVVGEKAFPAGVIADELGVSAYTIGIWGQRLGLKAPHGMRGPYGYWKNNQYFYNEQGVQMLLDHKDEITYGDSDF